MNDRSCLLTKVVLVAVVILSTLVSLTGSSSKEWSYEEMENDGPSHWGELSPSCNTGRQSPINIVDQKVKKTLGPFAPQGIYTSEQGADFVMVNDGHTVRLLIGNETDNVSSVLSPTDAASYILHSVDFHWGKTLYDGSEHSHMGKFYPMEIQFYHYNMKYANFERAKSKKDGLLVISTFAKLSANYSQVEHLIENFKQVKCKGNTTTVKRFNLLRLLPVSTDCYFMYHGSTTYPPCQQSVTWMIFSKPIHVHEKEVSVLQKISRDACVPHDNRMRAMAGNHRPIQPLHDRKVESNCDLSEPLPMSMLEEEEAASPT